MGYHKVEAAKQYDEVALVVWGKNAEINFAANDYPVSHLPQCRAPHASFCGSQTVPLSIVSLPEYPYRFGILAAFLLPAKMAFHASTCHVGSSVPACMLACHLAVTGGIITTTLCHRDST